MANVLGKIIRLRRKQLKLKVYELADKVGVKPEFITQIEKGHRLPSEKVLNKIVNALGMELKPYYYCDKHPDILPYIKADAITKNLKIDNAEIIFVKSYFKGKVVPAVELKEKKKKPK